MDLSDGEGSVTASESEASDTAGGGISGTVDDEAFEKRINIFPFNMSF